MRNRYVLGRADEFTRTQHYLVAGSPLFTPEVEKATVFNSATGALDWVRFHWTSENKDSLTLFVLTEEKKVIVNLKATRLDDKD